MTPKTISNTYSLTVAAGFVLSAVTASPAEAIPAFARKYKVECSDCHSAMPYLNASGRAFKEAGYKMVDAQGKADAQMESQERISDSQIQEKSFPISARFKGYVYNKVKDTEEQIRPAHEIEVMAAGSFWKDGSFFMELEGEDDGDFTVGAIGNFGWHPVRAANVVMGYGSNLTTDPYNSMRNERRPTATHKAPLDYGSSLGIRFRDDVSFINFYGRAGGFFYEASWSGGSNNAEGSDPRDYLGRLAYDFTPGIMVGGLYQTATRDRTAGELDVERFGFDFNLELGNIYASGLYTSSKEEPTGAASQTNDSAYLELYYTHKKGERPFLVPYVRYDWRESNDGKDELSVVTGQLNAYVLQNVRLGMEYSAEIETPGDRAKSNRVVLMADVNF